MGLVVVAKSEGRALAARIFAAGLLALGLLAAAPQGWAQTVPDDNSVSSAKIVNDAVTGEKIAAGAVSTTQLANAAYSGANITAGITTEKIADRQVTGAKLHNDAARSGGGLEVFGGTVQDPDRGLRIADGGVTTARIADHAVTNAKVAANSLDGNRIKNKTITGTQIADAAVDSDQIATGAIDNGHLSQTLRNQIAAQVAAAAGNAAGNATVANASVTGAKLAGNLVHNGGEFGGIDLSNVSINGTGTLVLNIADGAITTSRLANSSVTSEKIADGTITSSDFSAELLDDDGGIEISDFGSGQFSFNIIDRAINSARLDTGAVITNKIADSAVTTGKIADSAVTTGKIADSAVTTAKIMDGTILYDDVNAVDVGAGMQRFYHYQNTTAALSAAELVVGTVATSDTMQQHAANAVAAFQAGTRLTETDGYQALQGSSHAADQQTARELIMRLNSDIWAAQEIGSRSDKITGFAQASDTWSTAVAQDAYQGSSLRAQTNYLADRIGLDPHAAPLRYGSLQSQINYLFDTTSRQTAMVAALQDAYVPAGHRGGMTLGAATFGSEVGMSFSLATIVGSRSKLSMSGALTKDYHERLFRVGYSLAW